MDKYVHGAVVAKLTKKTTSLWMKGNISAKFCYLIFEDKFIRVLCNYCICVFAQFCICSLALVMSNLNYAAVVHTYNFHFNTFQVISCVGTDRYICNNHPREQWMEYKCRLAREFIHCFRE